MLQINMLYSLCLLLLVSVTKSEVNVELQEILTSKEIPGKTNDIEWEIKLSCKVTGESNDEILVKWEKYGTEIKLQERTSFSNDGDIYNLTIKAATKDDIGTYDCVVKSNEQAARKSVDLFGVSIPDTLKVTEGDKLQIHCLTFGNPREISWKIDNSTVTGDDERILLLADENGIPNSMLLIDKASQNDTAIYTCIASAGDRVIEKSSNVTVIDPNAALFPFLCICAEVAVLCVIIFICEKRRQPGNVDVKK